MLIKERIGIARYKLARRYLKLREKVYPTKYKCPICDYPISMCQCLYSGSAHTDRDKRQGVVLDHLYLFSKAQLRHLRALQYYWNTSYGDEEREQIKKQLRLEYKQRRI